MDATLLKSNPGQNSLLVKNLQLFSDGLHPSKALLVNKLLLVKEPSLNLH